MNMTTEKRRNGEVDFWKFVFAVLIMLFHSKNLAPGGAGYFIGGNIATDFFFIVSGVLMAMSTARQEETCGATCALGSDTRNFLLHKISGMMPEYYIAWGIGFLVEHIGRNTSLRGWLGHLASSVWELLFLQEAGFPGFTANAVTWYISAMLLAMLILYPLLRRNRDLFLHVIAPVIVIFVFGYCAANFKGIRGHNVWLGICTKGMVRAVAEIALGCICYTLIVKLKEQNAGTSARMFLTIVEFVGFGGVIAYSYRNGASSWDYLLVLMLAVAIIICFSGQSVLTPLFSHAVFEKLGRFSFPLYLCHGYWSHALPRILPDCSYNQRLWIFFAVSVATALFVDIVSKALRAHCKVIFSSAS